MKLRQNILNTVQRLLLLASALVAFAAAQPAAQARDQIPFRAVYDLELQMVVNPPFAQITSTGSALATLLGQVRAESVEETINLLTGEGVATHQFTAANGDTVLVDFIFIAVPMSATLFAVSGTWQITEGTGRFVGTSGSGAYEGSVEFRGPTTAAGHFVMTGTIASPGSLK